MKHYWAIIAVWTMMSFALIGGSAAGQPLTVSSADDGDDRLESCLAYGAGYFRIPGSDNCMKIGGYMRMSIGAGDQVYAQRQDQKRLKTYDTLTRADLQFTLRNTSEISDIVTHMTFRSQRLYVHDVINNSLRYGYIRIGGLEVGTGDSDFWRWSGYIGKVYYDDMRNPAMYKQTNYIRYIHDLSDRFSLLLALEQGKHMQAYDVAYAFSDNRLASSPNRADIKRVRTASQINSWRPNMVGGFKWQQQKGELSGVIAFDSVIEGWSFKVRYNRTLGDKLSLFTIAAWKTADDYYAFDRINDYGKKLYYRLARSQYGDWGGNWALWGGGEIKLNERLSLTSQLNVDEDKTLAASFDAFYRPHPDFLINPQLSLVQWNGDKKWDENSRLSLQGETAIQWVVRIQKSF